MPRVPHSAPFSDERLQIAMNDLVRGIRQDLGANKLRKHVAASARIAGMLGIVIVAAVLTIALIRRSTMSSVMPSDNRAERLESKQIPIPDESRPPRIELFEEDARAESGAAAPRVRELKRLHVIGQLGTPSGWVVPRDADMQSLRRALQATGRDEKLEAIAERLRRSVEDPQHLRSALLMASPALTGNEVRAAVHVLHALPGDRWESALETEVPKAAEPLRSAWLSLLGAGAEQNELRWLLPLLTSPHGVIDRDVVLCVASILERHPHRADPELALFLVKPVPQQLAVLEVVRKLGGSVSAELIGGFLHSSEPAIRASALRIYSELPHSPALPEIARALLSDLDLPVRLNALRAASRSKDLASIPNILELPDAGAEEAAARYRTLLEISGIKLPNDVAQWQAWWELDGHLIAGKLDETLNRLISGDVSAQAAATRELVPLNHFLNQHLRDSIRQQLQEGPAELRRASAYFLLATQASLTPKEAQLARELLRH